MKWALLLLPVLALADPGVNVKEEPQNWELRDGQGNPVKDAKGVWIRRTTYEECKTEAIKTFGAARVVELKYRCNTVVGLTITGVCGDVPEPAKPVDDDGFTVFPEDPAPEECPQGMPNAYKLLQNKWVVEYPKCGEYKPVEIQACGFVVKDEVVASNDPPADHPAVGSDPAEVCKTATCDEPGDVTL